MRIIFTLAYLLLAVLPASAANFPFIRLNGKTNVVSDNGTNLTYNGSAIGGGSVTNTFYNAQSYGWLADGTDHYVAASNLLATVYTAGGGTIFFPAATNDYRSDGQLVLPNDGSGPPPAGKNMRLLGASGVVIDLRYSGTNGGKFETRGSGTLWFDNLTLKDGGSSTNTSPFIHSSNTQLFVEKCTLIGAGGTNQDGIVLGGAFDGITGDVTGAFQGYGTSIRNNLFTRLNRGVYLRTWANNVIVSDNQWFHNTGTRAIESDNTAGSGGTGNYGNVISGNLIEMDTYQYGIMLQSSQRNYLAGNSFWDSGSNVVGYICVTNTSTQNVVINGHTDSGAPLLVGELVEMSYTTVIGAEASHTETAGLGIAASELAAGATVKGTYDQTLDYMGPFTVSDLFDVGRSVSIGYDGAAEVAVIQANKAGIGRKPIALNPLGGFVGIGLTNPAVKLDIGGADGNFRMAGTLFKPTNPNIQFDIGARAYWTFPADGDFTIANNAGTDFKKLQLGGITAAYPALARSSTNLVARLADDSADTAIRAAVYLIGTNTLSFSGTNIIVNGVTR